MRTFVGHENSINSICFSDDGKFALSGGGDRTVKYWEVVNGRCLCTLEGHTDRVVSVAHSADGIIGISGGHDGLRIWMLSSDKPFPSASWSVARVIESSDALKQSQAFHSKITGAKKALSSGDPKVAVELLREARAQLGYEREKSAKSLWDELSLIFRRKTLKDAWELYTFKDNLDSVVANDISIDGRIGISGSYIGEIQMWNVLSGRKLSFFANKPIGITSICVAPQWYTAYGGSDGTIKYLDHEQARVIAIAFGHSGPINAIYWSEDGGVFSGSDDGTLRLWRSYEKCCQIFVGHDGAVNSVFVSRDGKRVISAGDDGTMKLWEVESGECIYTFTGHNSAVRSVSMTSDGNYALSGSEDTTLILWDLSNKQLVRTFIGHNDSVNAVILCKDGKIALSGSSDGTLKIWDLFNGICLRTLTGHTGSINCLSINRDQNRVVSGSSDTTIKLWDITTGNCLYTFTDHTHRINAVVFEGDVVTSASNDQSRPIKNWDVKSNQCFTFYDNETSLVSTKLSQNLIFTESSCRNKRLLIVIDPNHQKILKIINDERMRSYNERVWHKSTLSVSKDSNYVLLGGLDNSLNLWNWERNLCLRTFDGHTNVVSCSCISDDNRMVLSGSEDCTVKLWDSATSRCIKTFEGHTITVITLCFSPDNRYAISGSEDKTIKIWDLQTGSCLQTLIGHTGSVLSVCVTEDSKYVISAGSDKTIRIWDILSGSCIRILDGHMGPVNIIALSMDGNHLISGSVDKSVKQWELDWELEESDFSDWDETARPYLQTFLTAQVPYTDTLPEDRQPTEDEITLALTRRGKPVWNEDDLQQLLYTLGCAGYGWLKPEGVRLELERISHEWDRTPLTSGSIGMNLAI